MKMVNISIIGAGSAAFSAAFIRDLCVARNLWGSTVTLMDIDEERLSLVSKFALNYAKATKADLRFKTTKERKNALKEADFVISTAKVVGHGPQEAEREIAEKHGYYRGIGDRVSDYYGTIGAYYQLDFFLSLARDMEDVCPEAWLIETANPVFEGTNLITRETDIKTVGVCHGHSGYKDIARILDISLDEVQVQIAGFNHCIWMDRFLYKGKDAYPLVDAWISEKAEDYWKSDKYLQVNRPWDNEQLSPSAVYMYKQFGLFPIGDTVRCVSPWWHHTDLETKKKWFGSIGGFDSEIGIAMYLSFLKKNIAKMERLADANFKESIKEFPPTKSGEQHIPIIDAIVNDKKTTLQLNIPNNGSISGIPDNVVVEIPVVVDGKGIKGIHVGELPRCLMVHVMAQRMNRMEQILQAFLDGDRKGLFLMLMEDQRTKSPEQAQTLLDELLSKPWNSDAAKHYR
jgi:alpha-galactosidase